MVIYQAGGPESFRSLEIAIKESPQLEARILRMGPSLEASISTLAHRLVIVLYVASTVKCFLANTGLAGT